MAYKQNKLTQTSRNTFDDIFIKIINDAKLSLAHKGDVMSPKKLQEAITSYMYEKGYEEVNKKDGDNKWEVIDYYVSMAQQVLFSWLYDNEQRNINDEANRLIDYIKNRKEPFVYYPSFVDFLVKTYEPEKNSFGKSTFYEEHPKLEEARKSIIDLRLRETEFPGMPDKKSPISHLITDAHMITRYFNGEIICNMIRKLERLAKGRNLGQIADDNDCEFIKWETIPQRRSEPDETIISVNRTLLVDFILPIAEADFHDKMERIITDKENRRKDELLHNFYACVEEGLLSEKEQEYVKAALEKANKEYEEESRLEMEYDDRLREEEKIMNTEDMLNDRYENLALTVDEIDDAEERREVRQEMRDIKERLENLWSDY